MLLREKEILNKLNFNNIEKTKHQKLSKDPFIATRKVDHDLVSICIKSILLN